jgi:hypothetical protein
MPSVDWEQILVYFIGNSPYWLAVLLAAAMCVQNYPQQPRRAVLIAISIGISLVNVVVAWFLFPLIHERVLQRTGSQEISMIAAQLTHSLPACVSFLLLAWAAFHGETSSPAGD